MSHGGGLDAAQVARLPGNPAVFDFVPQAEVLARARLAVLHGGLNTVMDALAAGVPIVAVPIAFEQGAIAARLEHAGAGQGLNRHFLTSSRLAGVMRDVLTTPRYHASAGRLAAEVAVAGGVSRAADIVEAVLRTGKPVHRGEVGSLQNAASVQAGNARLSERLSAVPGP